MEPLSDAVRRELSRFGGSADLAEICDRWTGVVGIAIARNAWPSRIARDGTVHVNTADSIWAFELAHRGPEIAARLEVAAVRFAPGPLAEAEAGEPPAAGAVPSEDELRRAAEIAAPIEDENLRKSVEKAVSLSLAQTRSDRLV